MADRARRIQALAERWGEVYLFHPAIGRDVDPRDWEQVFIEALPLIEQAADEATAQALIQTRVLDQLPERSAPARSALRCHLGWNEDGYPYVYRSGLVSTENQRVLGQSTEPSRAARILGLCKIGLVLRYFAPQVSEAAVELGALLAKWLPRIEAASGLDEYYRVLADLAAHLPDRHAGVIAPALDSSNAIERPSKPLVLGSAWLGQLHYLRALADNLVYMRPFAMPDVASLRAAFALIQNTRGLLLDLRGYPQTHFQHELVRCLCERPVASPRYEVPVVSGPDVSQRTWQVVQHTVRPDGRVVYPQPVVALIDATTQSSAEDFGMYLKIAGRVTFVGQRTAGCVGNATYVNLPGGGRFTFTGMRVTWPDGRPVWGIGLVPDVNVAAQAEILDTGLEVLQTLSVHEYARA